MKVIYESSSKHFGLAGVPSHFACISPQTASSKVYHTLFNNRNHRLLNYICHFYIMKSSYVFLLNDNVVNKVEN